MIIPDGVHFVTATTSPRMQIDNGFKAWDFTGKLIFEWKAPKHLLSFHPFYSESPPLFPDGKLQAVDFKLGNKVIPSSKEIFESNKILQISFSFTHSYL